MDVKHCIESGLLDKFAKNQTNVEDTKMIENLLLESEELGEALEEILTRLENENFPYEKPIL
ncbi:MAG: hypothetical protein EOO91_18140 [Pedobacter sp.]|nr:MAG: hypothetical protein EOO91_18140 [Pedobacter sp.]